MKAVFIGILATLVLSVGTAGATTPCQRNTTKLQNQVRVLQKQVRSLKSKNATLTRQRTKLNGQVTTLTDQVNTLTVERDVARSQLAQAQTGVAGALLTMAPEQIWPLFGSPIAGKFVTARWSYNYYTSGDYRSWSFTYCGFC